MSGGRWAWYTCEARHLDGWRPYPSISLGGTPSEVFDTWHAKRDENGRVHLPNATESQRRQAMLRKGWAYDVVEKWGEGQFECWRGWLCPWHADPENRGKVAGIWWELATA